MQLKDDNNFNRLPGSIILDQRHKLAYCPIPKSGCSTMKRMFWVLNGNANSKNPQDIGKGIHDIAWSISVSHRRDLREEVTTNFFKFLVVRNPIDRLWSAFLDKVYLRHYLSIKKYESFDVSKSDQIRSSKCRHNVTFFDLLLNIVKRGFFNAHVASYTALCRPCHIRYDAIAQLETFLPDMTYIFEKNKAIEDIDLSGYNLKSSTEDTARRIITGAITSPLNTFLRSTYTIDGKIYKCGNSSSYANRLWTSFIWRRYIPSSAPYPQRLRTGEDVSMELMQELYHNATSGAPYEASSYMPQSKDKIIKEAFKRLTLKERSDWLALFGSDFEMFGYSIPSYLKN